MLSLQNNIVKRIILGFIFFLLITTGVPAFNLDQPLVSNHVSADMFVTPLSANKNTKEVFGFAPYWNIDKLDNINFNVLTTLAYFDIKVDADGNIIYDDSLEIFKSKKATNLFKKAHSHGTRVVVTLTQMNNYEIEMIMDDPQAQENLINQSVELVKKRGIDGINIDFEYGSDPGQEYRDKFTRFVSNLTNQMHQEVPGSKVTVSVYASAVKDPKIYDIGALGAKSDGIFMMAYDFGYSGSDEVMPVAPLYGHKEGKYWYDISTAVEDFLRYMPSNKLILGVPYYGYNYPVSQPEVKAQTLWGGVFSQTYSAIKDVIKPGAPGIYDFISGWDDAGKVSWKAYLTDYGWRMIFVEDTKSLGIKYDFIKNKNLGGVGIWALGNDEGKNELWSVLVNKFGKKLADNKVSQKVINDNI
ncbi:MAG: hypothetical protein HYW86_01040 [Candidatus Roizmanbacteria bacterium]|nr:MAG: hypothetical protein HYW86_01040 [Candidatus Roizmanbacteria bacterium]